MYVFGTTVSDGSKATEKAYITTNDDPGAKARENMCPLCQDHFTSKDALVEHAVSFHSIDEEGLVSFHNWINSKSARKRYELSTDEIRFGNDHPAPLSKARKGS